MRSIVRRASALVALALVLVLPGTAFATLSATHFHLTNLTWQHCSSVADTSLRHAGFGDVTDSGSGIVYGLAGDYSASVACVDQQAVVVTVAGPDANVATAFRDRILAAY